MKRFQIAGVIVLSAGALSGCVKHVAKPPPPAATPAPTPIEEGADAAAERMKRKTGEAAAAIDDYLKANQPKLREKFQKFGDKYAKDKNVWREKLLQQKQELQPQIDALKRKARDLAPKARGMIDQQTAALEQESKSADDKLAQLEAATADGWKAFRDKLKSEEATPSPSPGATPAP